MIRHHGEREKRRYELPWAEGVSLIYRQGEREKHIYELSRTNTWYQYERDKKYLSPQGWETEVQELTRALKV